MAAWKCGWCGERASMTPVGDGVAVSRGPAAPNSLAEYMGSRHEADLYCTMRCANCAALSIARNDFELPSDRTGGTLDKTTEYWRHLNPDDWAPKWVEGQDFDYAPDHIESAASEAYKCLSVGAYMSAILMARTAIEAAAKDKGVTKGNLSSKIDELASAGLIREPIKEAAHKVRLFGNDMAHGDITVEVTHNDAEQNLRVLNFILQDLYELDVRMDEVGVSLDKRKAAGGNGTTP